MVVSSKTQHRAPSCKVTHWENSHVKFGSSNSFLGGRLNTLSQSGGRRKSKKRKRKKRRRKRGVQTETRRSL